MKGPPLGPGGEHITWHDQVAPRSRKASSTRNLNPQTSNPFHFQRQMIMHYPRVWGGGGNSSMHVWMQSM